MVDEDGRHYHIPQWTLADRLRKIRRDSGLCQEDFAHAIGVNATTYAQWESGRRQPDRVLELAAKVDEAFDVPEAWVLGLLDRPRSSDRVAAMQPQRRRATDRLTCVQ